MAEGGNIEHPLSGVIDIPPRTTTSLFVRTGPTVGEWKANPSRVFTVGITAWGAENGVEQHWELTIDTQVLAPVDNDAGRLRSLPHTLPEAELTGPVRRYPQRGRLSRMLLG